MAWTTIKWINMRILTAYVTDGANEVCLQSYNGGADQEPPPYTGANSNSPLTLNGDSFNAGWPGSTSAAGIARDRSASVDARLAGFQMGDASTTLTFQLQAGTAAGTYKIWLGVTDQGGYGFPAGTITIADALGTLTTVTLPSGHSSGTAVCDATGAVSANAAAWATANPAAGGGNFISVTTTDTSNGNGGPLLKFTCSAPLPLATVGILYTGGSGGSAPPPQPSPFAIGAGFVLAPLGWVIRRRQRRAEEGKK